MSLSGPFLFDPRAFWGDENVKMMTDEQVAAYVRLLSHQWEEGSIPASSAGQAAIISEGPRHWTPETFEARLKPALKPCFEPAPNDDDRLVNPRMHRERLKWVKAKKKLSQSGQRGGVRSGKSRRSKSYASKPGLKGGLSQAARVAEANPKPTRSISSSSSPSSSREDPCPSAAASLEVGEARAEAAAAEPEEMAYFHQVESGFLRLRGSGTLLSPADYQVARSWHDAGVPLDLVLGEIGKLFQRWREERRAGTINSLHYCAQAVEVAWAALRELQAPGWRGPEPETVVAYPVAAGDADERWAGALEKLTAAVDPEEMRTWLRPLAPVRVAGSHVLALAAPSERFVHTLAAEYRERIEAAIGGRVVFVAGRAEAAA